MHFESHFRVLFFYCNTAYLMLCSSTTIKYSYKFEESLRWCSVHLSHEAKCRSIYYTSKISRMKSVRYWYLVLLWSRRSINSTCWLYLHFGHIISSNFDIRMIFDVVTCCIKFKNLLMYLWIFLQLSHSLDISPICVRCRKENNIIKWPYNP